MNHQLQKNNSTACTFFLFTLLGIWNTGYTAEFVYRDLLGNTVASEKCQAKDQAIQRATSHDELNRFAKIFCETQGYGWHSEKRENTGALVCEECNSDPGKHQCHVEDVHVTCKRLKPGSVGLVPGKG